MNVLSEAKVKTMKGVLQSGRIVGLFMLLLLFLLEGRTMYGQEPTFGPLIAIHPGEHLFLEGGVGFSSTSSQGHGFLIMKGLTLSAEVKPAEEVILAPRATAWFTALIALGLGAGYYTDFEGGTFMIQPELGLGFAGGRITWRINFPVGNEIDGLNTSDLNVSVFLPVI